MSVNMLITTSKDVFPPALFNPHCSDANTATTRDPERSTDE